MSKKKKRNLQSVDSEKNAASDTKETAPSQVPVPNPKTESASNSSQSEKTEVSGQEQETKEAEFSEEETSSESSDEAGTEDRQRGNTSRWIWGVVAVGAILIAIWLAYTFIFNTPSPLPQQ